MPRGIPWHVYLAGRDAAGLAAYAKAVSDPSSPSYGKFLSAARTQARFGTTGAQVKAVTAWLKGAGLTVTGTNRRYIAVTGEVAAAERAFGAQHTTTVRASTLIAPRRLPPPRPPI